METLKSLYVDSPAYHDPILPDDFIIAVGKTRSNSVYHVAEVKSIPKPEKRIVRYYVKVFKSDLITALRRDSEQKLIPIPWYSRNKKLKK